MPVCTLIFSYTINNTNWMIMQRSRKVTHAYSQTPWRTQLRSLGLFLCMAVILLLMAVAQLDLTARIKTTGRQIQAYRLQIEALEEDIADQQTKLAFLTSAAEMKKRALDLGFRPASAEEITYIVVADYYEPSEVPTAPPAVLSSLPRERLSPEFTQSLLEWFVEEVLTSPVIANGRP